MKVLIYVCIIWFIIGYSLVAQNDINVDKWKEYIEDLADEAEESSEKLETLYAELSYLAEHPLDLNSVTEEQLTKLPFLTDRQVEQLIRYRRSVKAFVSIYELKAIPDMDFTTIELLYPFVYVGDISVNKRKITVENMLKYGHNDLIMRYDQCFQQKKGYGSYPDSVLQRYPNRKYLGEPFYGSVRYAYNFDERLQFGWIGEKDAGEPFWKEKYKGFDYNSFHFLLKDQKVLKTLALGDYKVSFGQGLVISHDFSPSRSAIVAQAERRSTGFRRHYSTNEYDFLRGAALTLQHKSLNVSMFYSYRKMDGALTNDTFPSFKTDGLHRLQKDWEKRHTIGVHTFGGNVRWVKPRYHIGITVVDYRFVNAVLFPQEQPYNVFYFRGKHNNNISVDYMLKSKSVKLFGETALSSNGAVATLNGLQLTPASYFTMLLLYRYYDKQYHALYGNAFGQNSTVQNEQGIYGGWQWSPFPHWKLSAYADFFRFPWLKYQADALQTGKEYMAQIDYSSRKQFSSYLRYKEKRRSDAGIQRKMRLQAVYGIASSWSFRSSVDGILYEGVDKKQERGYLIAQSMGWKPVKIPLQMDLYIACFSTDSYQVRLSSYEKNLLYAYYMPTFYGKGVRLAATLNWNICKFAKLSAKFGHTQYRDRETIGSGTEEIEGNRKSDLSLMMRFKL